MTGSQILKNRRRKVWDLATFNASSWDRFVFLSPYSGFIK